MSLLCIVSRREDIQTTPVLMLPQQVADLQVNLKQEQIIVEEKKAKTGALIETIGQEKAVVDEAVEAGREDEEAAAKLQVRCSPPFCASLASCFALKTCLGLYSFKQREQMLVPCWSGQLPPPYTSCC